MKTERRHELQTNDLANWLGQNLDKVKPYGMTILAVAIGVVVLGILWSVWSARSRQSEQDAWARFDLLTSSTYRQERLEAKEKELQKKYNDNKYRIDQSQEEVKSVVAETFKEIEKFAEEHKNSTVGCFAALMVADRSLGEGVEAVFTSRTDEARTRLDKAARFYQQAVDNAADPMLLARAQMGLARTLETRRGRNERDANADDIKVAQATYEKLKAVEFYSATAQQQIAAIKGDTPSGNFYQWFDEQLKKEKAASSPFGAGFNSSSPFGTGGDPVFDPTKSGPEVPDQGGAAGPKP